MGSKQYGNAHAAVTVTFDAEIAHFEMAGWATRESVQNALIGLYEYPNIPTVCGAIAYYDRCGFDINKQDLLAIYAHCQSGGLPAKIPTALVVKPEFLETAKSYCYYQSTSGVLRAAFTDRAEAVAWVSDMAALIKLQREEDSTR